MADDRTIIEISDDESLIVIDDSSEEEAETLSDKRSDAKMRLSLTEVFVKLERIPAIEATVNCSETGKLLKTAIVSGSKRPHEVEQPSGQPFVCDNVKTENVEKNVKSRRCRRQITRTSMQSACLVDDTRRTRAKILERRTDAKKRLARLRARRASDKKVRSSTCKDRVELMGTGHKAGIRGSVLKNGLRQWKTRRKESCRQAVPRMLRRLGYGTDRDNNDGLVTCKGQRTLLTRRNASPKISVSDRGIRKGKITVKKSNDQTIPRMLRRIGYGVDQDEDGCARGKRSATPIKQDACVKNPACRKEKTELNESGEQVVPRMLQRIGYGVDWDENDVEARIRELSKKQEERSKMYNTPVAPLDHGRHGDSTANKRTPNAPDKVKLPDSTSEKQACIVSEKALLPHHILHVTDSKTSSLSNDSVADQNLHDVFSVSFNQNAGLGISRVDTAFCRTSVRQNAVSTREIPCPEKVSLVHEMPSVKIEKPEQGLQPGQKLHPNGAGLEVTVKAEGRSKIVPTQGPPSSALLLNQTSESDGVGRTTASDSVVRNLSIPLTRLSLSDIPPSCVNAERRNVISDVEAAVMDSDQRRTLSDVTSVADDKKHLSKLTKDASHEEEDPVPELAKGTPLAESDSLPKLTEQTPLEEEYPLPKLTKEAPLGEEYLLPELTRGMSLEEECPLPELTKFVPLEDEYRLSKLTKETPPEEESLLPGSETETPLERKHPLPGLTEGIPLGREYPLPELIKDAPPDDEYCLHKSCRNTCDVLSDDVSDSKTCTKLPGLDHSIILKECIVALKPLHPHKLEGNSGRLACSDNYNDTSVKHLVTRHKPIDVDEKFHSSLRLAFLPEHQEGTPDLPKGPVLVGHGISHVETGLASDIDFAHRSNSAGMTPRTSEESLPSECVAHCTGTRSAAAKDWLKPNTSAVTQRHPNHLPPGHPCKIHYHVSKFRSRNRTSGKMLVVPLVNLPLTLNDIVIYQRAPPSSNNGVTSITGSANLELLPSGRSSRRSSRAASDDCYEVQDGPSALDDLPSASPPSASPPSASPPSAHLQSSAGRWTLSSQSLAAGRKLFEKALRRSEDLLSEVQQGAQDTTQGSGKRMPYRPKKLLRLTRKTNEQLDASDLDLDLGEPRTPSPKFTSACRECKCVRTAGNTKIECILCRLKNVQNVSSPSPAKKSRLMRHFTDAAIPERCQSPVRSISRNGSDVGIEDGAARAEKKVRSSRSTPSPFTAMLDDTNQQPHKPSSLSHISLTDDDSNSSRAESISSRRSSAQLSDRHFLDVIGGIEGSPLLSTVREEPKSPTVNIIDLDDYDLPDLDVSFLGTSKVETVTTAPLRASVDVDDKSCVKEVLSNSEWTGREEEPCRLTPSHGKRSYSLTRNAAYVSSHDLIETEGEEQSRLIRHRPDERSVSLLSVPSHCPLDNTRSDENPPVVVHPLSEPICNLIEACLEEIKFDSEKFSSQVEQVLLGFCTVNSEPPEKMLRSLLFDILFHQKNNRLIPRVYQTLITVVDMYPAYGSLFFSWNDIEMVLQSLQQPFRNVEPSLILTLDVIVTAMESEFLHRSLKSQRQISKSCACKMLSVTGHWQHVQRVIHCIESTLSQCEFDTITNSFKKLHLQDQSTHGEDIKIAHQIKDTSPKILPLLHRLIHLSFISSRFPESAAHTIGVELAEVYMRTVSVHNKRLILSMTVSPYLRFKITQHLLETFCQNASQGGVTDLCEIVASYFKCEPPCNSFTPPATPSRSEDEDESALNHGDGIARRYSEQACEEVAMLLVTAVQSYLLFSREKHYLPLNRRMMERCWAGEMREDDRQYLASSEWVQQVEQLTERLKSFCPELTPTTYGYLAQLDCLAL